MNRSLINFFNVAQKKLRIAKMLTNLLNVVHAFNSGYCPQNNRNFGFEIYAVLHSYTFRTP